MKLKKKDSDIVPVVLEEVDRRTDQEVEDLAV